MHFFGGMIQLLKDMNGAGLSDLSCIGDDRSCSCGFSVPKGVDHIGILYNLFVPDMWRTELVAAVIGRKFCILQSVSLGKLPCSGVNAACSARNDLRAFLRNIVLQMIDV